MCHLEEAAICGIVIQNPNARHRFGWHEKMSNENAGRAMKHWTISATQGYDLSMKSMNDMYIQHL